MGLFACIAFLFFHIVSVGHHVRTGLFRLISLLLSIEIFSAPPFHRGAEFLVVCEAVKSHQVVDVHRKLFKAHTATAQVLVPAAKALVCAM